MTSHFMWPMISPATRGSDPYFVNVMVLHGSSVLAECPVHPSVTGVLTALTAGVIATRANYRKPAKAR
jgi:hypothetical protein